jgi:hypothetical protein
LFVLQLFMVQNLLARRRKTEKNNEIALAAQKCLKQDTCTNLLAHISRLDQGHEISAPSECKYTLYTNLRGSWLEFILRIPLCVVRGD